MFNFIDLDETTRRYMLEAIEEAEQTNNIYFSPRFNDAGKQLWLPLLKEAARDHNEHWLAYQLEENETMTGVEVAAKPSGGYSIRHVPHTAAETQAESQFNRFYMLGLAKRARAEGIPHLEVYRARERAEPRPESEALVGKLIPIEEIEADLKETKSGFGSQLGQPNSGLSVKLPFDGYR
jgi:hypothetical protein